MKDLITAIGSLFLLMVFVMQFAGNQIIHTRMFQSEAAINTFCDVMKEQGGITEENEQQLRKKLTEICGCSELQISVAGVYAGQTPAESGALLSYSVQYPLENLIVMGSMLGIGPEENCVRMKQEGWVVSCYEEPDCNIGTDSSDEHGNGT